MNNTQKIDEVCFSAWNISAMLMSAYLLCCNNRVFETPEAEITVMSNTYLAVANAL